MAEVCRLCISNAGLDSDRCQECERRQAFTPDKDASLDLAAKKPLTLAELSKLTPEERMALLAWALEWIRWHDAD